MEPESAESFYARVAAATGADGRLPVDPDGDLGWDVFPFEAGSLRVKPLGPLADADPPRRGEDPAECWCASAPPLTDATIWHNERWRLSVAEPTSLPVSLVLGPLEHHDLPGLPAELAAEMGQLVVSVSAAMEALPSVGRAQLGKFGDGGAHLHLFFFGRPARMPQLRGSPLLDWSACLPELPADVHRANAAYVAGRVAVDMGGTAVTPA
ncbi:hypothetical protein [Xylanimonas protaetiae]|uniref:HIT domain-containing protein n=1 Tax=Xylanimonas protaetiae TaxID=2509457 RepID=A0A4P6F2Z9_9MICO|nr:hypothetical protein [Xylanimonas protaetiae]QAY69636.1 hypothetical protein ET471_05945 [Xylanimonas protaetiae]